MKKFLITLITFGSMSISHAQNLNISFPLVTTDGDGTYFTQTCTEDKCDFTHDVKFKCNGVDHPHLTVKRPVNLFKTKTYKVLIKNRNYCNNLEKTVLETIVSNTSTNSPKQYVWIYLDLSKGNSWLDGYSVQ